MGLSDRVWEQLEILAPKVYRAAVYVLCCGGFEEGGGGGEQPDGGRREHAQRRPGRGPLGLAPLEPFDSANPTAGYSPAQVAGIAIWFFVSEAREQYDPARYGSCSSYSQT